MGRIDRLCASIQHLVPASISFFHVRHEDGAIASTRPEQETGGCITIQQWLHHFLSDFVWNVSETIYAHHGYYVGDDEASNMPSE